MCVCARASACAFLVMCANPLFPNRIKIDMINIFKVLLLLLFVQNRKIHKYTRTKSGIFSPDKIVINVQMMCVRRYNVNFIHH